MPGRGRGRPFERPPSQNTGPGRTYILFKIGQFSKIGVFGIVWNCLTIQNFFEKNFIYHFFTMLKKDGVIFPNCQTIY